MTFYLKEWVDGTTTIINEEGKAVWSFSDMDEAVDACSDLCLVRDESINNSDYMLDFP